MNFDNYFDMSYIVNLEKRPDRLEKAIRELRGQGISNIEVVKAYEAIGHRANLGIYLSMYQVIEKSYFAGHERIAFFEDDVMFVNSLENWIYANEFAFKPTKFHILYLGCNSHELHEARVPFKRSRFDSLLIVMDVYACHAMIISREGMFQILKAMTAEAKYSLFSSSPSLTDDIINELGLKYFDDSISLNDVLIQQKIQPLGKCFATYPMIATQRPGYSDIEKKHMEQDYILTRFNQQTDLLFNK